MRRLSLSLILGSILALTGAVPAAHALTGTAQVSLSPTVLTHPAGVDVAGWFGCIQGDDIGYYRVSLTFTPLDGPPIERAVGGVCEDSGMVPFAVRLPSSASTLATMRADATVRFFVDGRGWTQFDGSDVVTSPGWLDNIPWW
jgi:hypothetical protein